MTRIKRLLRGLSERETEQIRSRVEPSFGQAAIATESQSFRIKQRRYNRSKTKSRLLQRLAWTFSELSLVALCAAGTAIAFKERGAQEWSQSTQTYPQPVESERHLNGVQVENRDPVSRGTALYFSPDASRPAAGHVTWTRRQNSELRANVMFPESFPTAIKFFRPLDKGVDAEFLVEIQFGAATNGQVPTDISAISLELGADSVGVGRPLAGALAPLERGRFWFALTRGLQTYNKHLLTGASWLNIRIILEDGETAHVRVEFPDMANAFFEQWPPKDG